MLKNIAISLITPSKTNPRGKNFSGKEFDELVASVKEKGILMPILVRPVVAEGHKDFYEIVAGHRRFAAAQESDLKEIPANIQEMTDVEAREAQIVENLQRQDIHPLDEGEAYRLLIEKSRPRYETTDVALKVGKSDSYVRGRLSLTNLSEKAATAFRKDLMTIGHALLISRLDDEKIQADALKRVIDHGDDVSELREWIQERVYLNLSNKPWAKNAKLTEMVGDNSKKGPSLFGDPSAGVDPAAFAAQMASYIEIKRREYQSKGVELIRISTDWGTPEVKGALAKDKYTIIEKARIGDYKTVQDAIVVEGPELGKIVKITTDKEEVKGSTLYKPTQKEKDERKKELEKSKKKKEKMAENFQEAIAKIKWPLSSKQLDALMDFAFSRCGYSYQQPTCILMGLEPVMKKEKIQWGEKEGQTRMTRDYELTLKKFAADNGDIGKLKVIFGLLMPHPSESYTENFTAGAKKL